MNIYQSPLCSCIICKEVKSAKGIYSHCFFAHTVEGKEQALKAHKLSKIPQKLALAQRKLDKIYNYESDPKYCIFCKSVLSYNKRKNDFCSRSCSASRQRRQRPVIINNSKKFTKAVGPYTKLLGRAICKNCNKEFWNTGKLCCSIECRDNIRSKNGTLRKRIVYNNMVFQSSWEVTIAKFLDQNSIKWSQPRKRLKWNDTTLNKIRTYLPDFFLDDFNQWLDVKNPHKQKQDADKISQLCILFPLFVGNIKEVKEFVVQLTGVEPACVL